MCVHGKGPCFWTAIELHGPEEEHPLVFYTHTIPVSRDSDDWFGLHMRFYEKTEYGQPVKDLSPVFIAKPG